MAHDPELADRIRVALAEESAVSERAMFGGLGFMIDGAMAVAAGSGGSLMLRVTPSDAAELAGVGGLAPMEMRGGPIRGWMLADAAATASDESLRALVARGVAAARRAGPRKRR